VAVCGYPFTARLDIDSSILDGGLTSISTPAGVGVSTAGVSYSQFSAPFSSAPGNSVTEGDGNLQVSPGFLGASDFHLASDSPLIDKGNPAGLTAGESATDLAGAPRIVGRRDIGAYEFQTPAAVPPGTPPAVTPPAATPPSGKKCKKKKGKKRASAAKKKCKKKGKKGNGKR
jgi:hypothetical protein